MINVRRISHATFETPDLDRQIDYFTEIAGLALAQRENGRAFLATKLGDLAFVVPEPKEYADFYVRVLGFRVSDWIGDWFVFMRCGPDHHTVNFVRGKRTQMHHIAFELKDWAQVQSACDFLGARNI